MWFLPGGVPLFFGLKFYLFTLIIQYHAIFERDQENEADGDVDEEGGEGSAADTHYLEGLEEEEEGDDGMSSAGHMPVTTPTSGDGYGVAL